MSKLFKAMGISEKLVQPVAEMRITQPTPVQEQAIPAILAGKDVIGQSQTGTGKTLAFLLPLLQKINIDKSELQVMILSPTRELCLQIFREVEKLTVNVPIRSQAIFGGTDIKRQIEKLKRDPQLIVGTPGRVYDLIQRKKISAHTIKSLVIDEADQMLDMGFMKEVEGIIRSTKRDRQLLLFSATMPGAIVKLTETLLKSPVRIHIEPKQKLVRETEQTYFVTKEREKDELFFKLARLYNPYLAVVFTNTKDRAQILSMLMKQRGFNVDVLHGDLPQRNRKQVMDRFREAKIQFLVATDIAARGLDVEGITHVFNYEVPRDPEQFIHRVGRTGRAGESGIAVTLITPKELFKLKKLSVGATFHMKIVVDDEIVDAPKGKFMSSDFDDREERRPRRERPQGRDSGNRQNGDNRRGSNENRRDDERGKKPTRTYGKSVGSKSSIGKPEGARNFSSKPSGSKNFGSKSGTAGKPGGLRNDKPTNKGRGNKAFAQTGARRKSK